MVLRDKGDRPKALLEQPGTGPEVVGVDAHHRRARGIPAIWSGAGSTGRVMVQVPSISSPVV